MTEPVYKDKYFRTMHDDLGKPDPMLDVYLFAKAFENVYAFVTRTVDEATGQEISNISVSGGHFDTSGADMVTIVIDGQTWTYGRNDGTK